MKQEIINILRQFEQRDYKKGGVSLAPEMYDTVAEKLVKLFCQPAVSGRSELLKAFVEFYNNRQNRDKWICYDEIDIYLESL